MNKDKLINEIEKWNQDLLDKSQKEKKKKQYREWGKLGGRPKKGSKKLTEKMLVSLTLQHKNKLDEISETFGLRPQELIRNLISNTQPRDPERNKILLEYRANFRRISNHFRSAIWTEAEKEKFTQELNDVIILIEKQLKTKK